MSASSYYDKKGRLVLEDSAGELWLVYESSRAHGRFELLAPPGSLIFASHAGDRVLTPAPEAYMHLSADELEECLRRTVKAI